MPHAGTLVIDKELMFEGSTVKRVVVWAGSHHRSCRCCGGIWVLCVNGLLSLLLPNTSRSQLGACGAAVVIMQMRTTFKAVVLAMGHLPRGVKRKRWELDPRHTADL